MDFDTGALPAAPAATAAPSPPVSSPSPPGIGWVAVISCDRGWWEHNSGAGGVADGVPYPDPEPPPRRVELRGTQNVIGRASGSTIPDIDCGSVDTGVSRRHAQLTLEGAQGWTLTDLGSTNGTYVGDPASKIEAGTATAFDGASVIKLGAFTVVRIEQDPPGA